MQNLKLLFVFMFVAFIYNGCKKVEINDIKKATVNKSQYYKEEKEYLDRIMSFDKLSVSERKKIVKSITFTKGIPNGINGTGDILDKLSKKDLLSFFETFFDNNSVSVIDGSDNMDRIIVQSYSTLTKEQLRLIPGGQANFGAVNCWVSIKGKKNSGDTDHPCEDSWPLDYCIYWNYNKPGCR